METGHLHQPKPNLTFDAIHSETQASAEVCCRWDMYLLSLREAYLDLQGRAAKLDPYQLLKWTWI